MPFTRAARGGRPLLSFGLLHGGNTMLNMGFTLLQLLVLARILPLDQYSEVVFLTAVGFYLQPIDQALGKAGFVALRAGREAPGGATSGRRDVVATLAGQALLLIAVALIVPSLLASPGSGRWVADVLFLFLGLATNYWAFELQSTAWALERNLPFVRLAIAHRLVHYGALGLAAWTGSFLLFGVVASCATLTAVAVAGAMLARAGLFRAGAGTTDWRGYARIFGVSLLATVTDLVVLNAPYGLIAARFGIGPVLVVFDSVMKVARIAMAGARTLAEIALTRHAAMVGAGRLKEARRLFLLVAGASVGATLVPALAVAFAGPWVFHLLLGANDVVPVSATLPAATVILASALYQPAVFFLGYSNRRGPVQALTLGAALALGVLAAGLFLFPLGPSGLLALFGACFTGVALAATWLADRLFRFPPPVNRVPEAGRLAEAALAAEPAA